MKTITILTIILGLGLLTHCEQKKDDPEILKNPNLWSQPGLKCTDYDKTGNFLRRYNQNRQNDLLSELIFVHGQVCIYAASGLNLGDNKADWWLVSIRDKSSEEILWPQTWIISDHLIGLLGHCFNPRSEYFLLPYPVEINLVDDWIYEAKPLCHCCFSQR